jgi:hypothetical protein
MNDDGRYGPRMRHTKGEKAMTTRRAFIRNTAAMAGVIFTGCSMRRLRAPGRSPAQVACP